MRNMQFLYRRGKYQSLLLSFAGQGHFGKVYTAINNESGDIMAMKEIPLQPNDHKTLRNVADELRIFESIHHKHLINHYGVEVRTYYWQINQSFI